jgi:predicted amidohydrolase
MKRPLVSAVALLAGLAGSAIAQTDSPDAPPVRSRADQPPRKVVVGTAIYGPYGNKTLDDRLQDLAGIIDEMGAQARRIDPQGGLDLAVLPEEVVTSTRGRALDRALPIEGRIQETFGALARKQSAYIIAPMTLAETGPEGPLATNAAVLFDRQGNVAGIYRKVHPVTVVGNPGGPESLENGMTPGRDFPVFDCDFGRLGIQICWDIQFEEGWRALARQGAELIAWPSASPATILPASRAAALRTYIVSATWREDATIFEPTGMVAAQIEGSGGVLVHQIDLSYAVLGWSSVLDNGKALERKFGDKVGYHYSEREDVGIFWSNDPATSIGAMYRALGLEEVDFQIQRNRALLGPARDKLPRTSLPGGR